MQFSIDLQELDVLWYDRKATPQGAEPNCADINAVNFDGAFFQFDDAKQSLYEGTLSTAGPSHTSNLQW